MSVFSEVEPILAESLPGYVHRPQQKELSDAIEQAIDDNSHLIVQAPVGTGKSIGALIPAIMKGKRVIVATATNLLANQYNTKDLPFLKRHLPVDFSYAMVKGRGNYYCPAEGQQNEDRTPYIQRIRDEIAQRPGHMGDLDSFSFPIPQEDRKYLSISSVECPGLKACKVGRELGCPSQVARDRAQEADVVVTNISSLIINARIGDKLLGSYDLMIIDEGHNLDPYALGALEATVNFSSIRTLAERAMEHMQNAEELHRMIEATDYMSTLMEALMEGQTFLKIDAETMVDMVDDWLPILGGVEMIRSVLGERSRRALERAEANVSDVVSAEVGRSTMKLSRQAENLQETLENLILGEGDFVRWLEKKEIRRGREVQERTYLRLSPIESAPFLRNILWGTNDEEEESPRIPVVLMSGTLAVNGKFTFAKRTVGAWEANELEVDSPFDYQNQARLFVPNRMVPPPGRFEEWLDWYSDSTGEILDASHGAGLLLFTSRRAMTAVYERMAGSLRQKGIRVIIQDGETDNQELGRIFNEDEHSVLFALKSFFEGFDPKLGSCKAVILDKLPFRPPTDIIFEARSAIVEEEGGSPFAELAIPDMATTLAQAMGRLIRSNDHRGLMAIMDSRISSSRYGSQVLKGLPPVPKTERVSEAVRFLRSIE